MRLLSGAQIAVIKKDIREAMSNKMVKVTMILVPLFMVLFLPVLFTIIAYFLPEEMNEFGPLLTLLPIQFSIDEMVQASYYYVMNYMTPMFFLMVPIMAASVAAGSSFIGEKERRTLETILFSPLTVNQLFHAKVLGAMCVAMMVTGIAFFGFVIVSIVGSMLIYKGFVLNIGIWVVIMLLIVPSISLAGVTAIVLASARAKTFQEAQQYAAILIVPVMLVLILPQVTGIFLFNAPQLLLLGLAFLAAALLMLWLASTRFTPEKLLK